MNICIVNPFCNYPKKKKSSSIHEDLLNGNDFCMYMLMIVPSTIYDITITV